MAQGVIFGEIIVPHSGECDVARHIMYVCIMCRWYIHTSTNTYDIMYYYYITYPTSWKNDDSAERDSVLRQLPSPVLGLLHPQD